MSAKKQIKSKKRVADHGEVYTSEREVNAMLDLVNDETFNIESRFLEPAAGNGNFLAEVLRRKLSVVHNRYCKNQVDYEKFALIALMSIYGVELLNDNAQECRQRLYHIFAKSYKSSLKKELTGDYNDTVKYVLERNILCGDALSMKQEDGTPIIFSEWTFVTGSLIKRRDFRFDELLEMSSEQMTIPLMGWEYDSETKAYIPAPLKEYPPIDYWRIQENGN
jgi:hypothetical protein